MAKKSFSALQATITVAITFVSAGVGMIAHPDVINNYGFAMIIVGCIFAGIATGIFIHGKRTEKEMSRTLLRLVELREEGVHIRNDGMNLERVDELAPWIERADNWNKAVVSEIGRRSKSDSTYFKTLNLVPQLQFTCQILNAQHLKWLREHNERIRRLEGLIGKYERHANSK